MISKQRRLPWKEEIEFCFGCLLKKLKLFKYSVYLQRTTYLHFLLYNLGGENDEAEES